MSVFQCVVLLAVQYPCTKSVFFGIDNIALHYSLTHFERRVLPELIQQLSHFSFVEVNHIQHPADTRGTRDTTINSSQSYFLFEEVHNMQLKARK